MKKKYDLKGKMSTFRKEKKESCQKRYIFYDKNMYCLKIRYFLMINFMLQ